MVLNFTGNNVLSTVHSQDNVRLVQHQQPATASAGAQDVEITASAIDFFVAGGRRLQRADTSGPAQIALRPTPDTGQQTLVTAGKFQARFDDSGTTGFGPRRAERPHRVQDSGPARPRQHQRHA